jgi:hypothetical protein
MATSRFPGRSFQLREYVEYTGRQEANRSLVRWQLWIDKTGGDYTYSFQGQAHRWMKLDGRFVHEFYGNGFDFRNGQNFLLASGETWIEHEWNGFKSFSIEAWANFDMLGATSLGSRIDLPRIPKTPEKPTSGYLDNYTPTSVRVNSAWPDNMGAGIEEFQFVASPVDQSGQIFTSNSGPVHDVTGLTPGRTYLFQVRARNSVGWSPWSDGVYGTPGLAAPALVGWAQIGDALRATWTPPDETSGLTGYRIQVSTSDSFATIATQIDVGDVRQADVPALPGGRRYWARVAARTEGGVNAYSSARDVMLILSSGDLDGWTRASGKPASLAYFTADGIRRGTLNGLDALYLESIGTGTGDVVPEYTIGICRTLTGLTPGKSYRVRANMTGLYDDFGDTRAITFALSANGITAAPMTLPEPSATVALPWVEFIATGTSALVQIVLAAALQPAPADAEAERVAFHGITVTELSSDYRQRLRNTVYESNLANHFDLACNSVGATWYVAKDGVTRFAAPAATLPISAVFADASGDGVLEFVDIAAGYDTLGTVNRIEATNYGIGEDGLEQNDTIIANEDDSQARFGVLSTRLDVNLWNAQPYDQAAADRLQLLLADHTEPELFVSEIRWNAQQDLAALVALEIGQRIRIIYRGVAQDSQIVGLTHDVQPTRWMTTLTLQKL